MHVPYSHRSGINIGECRATVGRALSYMYPEAGSPPAIDLFRNTADYIYGDNDGALHSAMRVISYESDAKKDTVVFAPNQANAALKSATLEITYVAKIVESVSLRLRLASQRHEVSPEDLINGPVIFPLSTSPQFLSRGSSEPPSSGAPHPATIFLFRSEHGFYTVTERSARNESDSPSLKPVQIDATVLMTKRDR